MKKANNKIHLGIISKDTRVIFCISIWFLINFPYDSKFLSVANFNNIKQMPKITYSISVPFDAERLFDLVADIEAYPLFLPWCSAARIINKKENITIAELVIRYKIFSSSYTSRVTFIPKREILVELVDGPFKFLENSWKFIQNHENTNIEFSLNFELKSKFLEDLLQEKIDSYANEMLQAFVKRAEELFSNSGACL